MTGELHGTNHSATARSNERAARQQRSADAIDARHNGELTFSGVLKELKAHSQLTEADGHYTAQLHASNQKAILSMLGKVNAEITAFGITSMIVEFKAPHIVHDDVCEICGVVGRDFVERENVIVCPEHAKPLALANMHNVLMLSAPPQMLMLPAQCAGDTRTCYLSEGDDRMHQVTVISTGVFGVLVQYEYKHHLFPFPVWGQKVMPHGLAYQMRDTSGLEHPVTIHELPTMPERQDRTPQAVKEFQATRQNARENAAAYLAKRAASKKSIRAKAISQVGTRRNATPEEIEAIQKVGREQGATARKHNAIQMDIVGQTERGTDVKRPRFSVGGQMA